MFAGQIPDDQKKKLPKEKVNQFGQNVIYTQADCDLDDFLENVNMVGDLPLHMSMLPKNIWGVKMEINGITYYYFKSEDHEKWYIYFFGQKFVKINQVQAH